MRYQGKITTWKDEQGFGFVTPNSGGETAFVHIKAFSERSRRPAEGDKISYELTRDDLRRLRADNIQFIGKSAHNYPSVSWNSLFVMLFFAFLTTAVYLNKLHFAVLGIYFVASGIALFLYATDKSAAENNRWRIPENTLHLCSLFGGWPGALLAQKKLRHKTKKTSFQIVFWLTVVMNCAVLAWIFMNSGTAFMNVTAFLNEVNYFFK